MIDIIIRAVLVGAVLLLPYLTDLLVTVIR